MPLHNLNSLTVGVPDVKGVRSYYEDFGLSGEDGGWMSTTDGGKQLRLMSAPRRQLLQMEIGVDDPDDISRIAGQLRRIDIAVSRVSEDAVTAIEPVTGVQVIARVTRRGVQQLSREVAYNQPGRINRPEARAPGILREGKVRPRKLGHVVIGSIDQATSQRFFTDGFGLKVSDQVRDAAAFIEVLVRPPQRPGPASADQLPSPHLVAGRRHRRNRARRDGDARRRSRTPCVGTGTPLHRLQLLLVPQRPGRDVLRVLFGPRLHR